MSLFPSEGSLMPLRWTQIPVPDKVAEAFREGHKHVMVQAPCGWGKTVFAAHIMSRSAAKGVRPMFMAPAVALINQTLKSFERQGLSDIGVMQANHPRTNPYAHTQLASRDTLIRRQMPQVRLVINDEAHDQRDKINALLEGVWADTYVIGLSATPWSRGLGRYYSKLIIADTVSSMIDQGRLSPFKVWAPDDQHEANASGVKRLGGEFREDEAARIMGEARLVGDAVESWLRRRQAGEHCGDRTFLYGVNRAHAKSLMEKFQAEGVACGYIDGNSTDDERRDTFDRYRRREDKVLCNVGVLITGVDEDVRVIVDCALRASEINWVQAFGRGLRLADGKDYLRFYDHGGNAVRLGLPTWIHHDHLDTRGPKDKGEAYEDDKPAPKPRKCQACNAIIPPATRACPSCGAFYQPANRVEHVAGELVEMSSAIQKQEKPAKKLPRDERQVFYSGLLAMKRDNPRFSDKWVAAKYWEKFGVWPNGLAKVPAYRADKKVTEFVYAQLKAHREGKRA